MSNTVRELCIAASIGWVCYLLSNGRGADILLGWALATTLAVGVVVTTKEPKP